MKTAFHVPVLHHESLHLLLTDDSKIYVDATVGGGGHSEALCTALSSQARLICMDADVDALQHAGERLQKFGDQVTFVQANFRNLRHELRELGIDAVQGVLMDLGVSSFQLDEGARGFSFRSDDVIDMRMDRRQPLTGRDIVNTYTEGSIADILWKFGEERNARKIARRIVAARPMEKTGDLREAVEAAVGGRLLTKTLARVFQAIRIEVNNELVSLERALADIVDLLAPGGRVVVISYHSLEDRIVKEFFRNQATDRIPSGNKYVADTLVKPKLKILTARPVTASATEVRKNPRARSAKLRAAERIPE